MKIFPALVCLLLVSGVGCGRQSHTPAPAENSPPAVNPSPPATQAPAAAPSQAATAKPAESTGGVDEETPVQVGADTAQDPAKIRLAEAMTPAAEQKPESWRWKEGENYKPLVPAQPTDVAPGKIEVVEVFWYGCPHCYALDPYLEAWNAKKASYIQFVRIPVVWNSGNVAQARLFYALAELGRADLHTAVFRETQVAGNSMVGATAADTERLQTAFAKQQGIKEEDFRKALHSLGVDAKVQRAQDLTRRYRVEGVPTIVINGKYTADAAGAGGPQQLIDLINDLAAREHKK